jgi:hypothetical protein
MAWYVKDPFTDEIRGPLENAELKAMANQGRIDKSSAVATSANGPWVEAARVKGLFTPPTTSVKADDAGEQKRQVAPANQPLFNDGEVVITPLKATFGNISFDIADITSANVLLGDSVKLAGFGATVGGPMDRFINGNDFLPHRIALALLPPLSLSSLSLFRSQTMLNLGLFVSLMLFINWSMWRAFSKTTSVVITASGKKHYVVTSDDRAENQWIASAINQAIEQRRQLP